MDIIEKINAVEAALHVGFVNLSQEIWNHPELGHKEYFASDVLTKYLKQHGFAIEKPFAGFETAFAARYESGIPGPVVGYLAEYDALPNIGHGCGHNLIGTIATGSAVVLSQLIGTVGGSIVVYGCPAEETSGAKVKMAEAGCFDALDVALMAHPESAYYKSGVSLTLEALKIEYFGKAAHAATSPQDGISALESIIQFFVNINGLRQRIYPTANIHGIIRNGGDAANIVPDYTSAEMYIRAGSKEYLDELSKQVRNCASAAALSTGTTVTISNFEASYYNLITNQTLSQQATENFLAFGCNRVNEPRKSYGSIDMGNVSHRCPAIHPYFSIAKHGYITAHSREFTDAAVSEYAHEQMAVVIKSLAKTGYDVISDRELNRRIREEFNIQNKNLVLSTHAHGGAPDACAGADTGVHSAAL